MKTRFFLWQAAALAVLVRCASPTEVRDESRAPAYPSSGSLVGVLQRREATWQAVFAKEESTSLQPDDVMLIWESAEPIAVGRTTSIRDQDRQSGSFPLQIQCTLPGKAPSSGARVELLQAQPESGQESSAVPINMGFCFATTSVDEENGTSVLLNIGEKNGVQPGARYQIIPKGTQPRTNSNIYCHVKETNPAADFSKCVFENGFRSNTATLDGAYALYVGQIPSKSDRPLMLQHQPSVPPSPSAFQLSVSSENRANAPIDYAITGFKTREELMAFVRQSRQGIWAVTETGSTTDARPVAYFESTSGVLTTKEGQDNLMLKPLCFFQTPERQALVSSGMSAAPFSFENPPPLGGCVVRVLSQTKPRKGRASSLLLNLGWSRETLAKPKTLVRILGPQSTTRDPNKAIECKITRLIPNKRNLREQTAECNLQSTVDVPLENAFGIVERLKTGSQKGKSIFKQTRKKSFLK